jgi:hypothetical protein
MFVSLEVHEKTRNLLAESVVDAPDTDSKIRRLLQGEYLREMARFRRTDRRLSQKYGMDFDAFYTQEMVRKHNYSWAVEQDAMEWETAIGGLQTMKRKLHEVQTLENEQYQ